MSLNPSLKSLQIFTSIMDLGSLSKAADNHHLSESAASRQLASLEGQLGFALFFRDKRQLIPTQQGKQFYREAQRLLYALQELPDIVEDIKQSQYQQLRLVSVPRLVRQIVSPALACLSQRSPELKIHFDVQPMRYIQRWLAGFQFHIGLGRLPAQHSDIVTERFASLPAVVILPKGHRLAKRSELSLDTLQDEALISCFTQQTLLGRNLVSIFNQAGLQPKPTIETASSQQACSIVASGFGYTISDPLSGHDIGDDVVMVPLASDFVFDFAFFLPQSSQSPPVVREFADEVRVVSEDYLKRLSAEGLTAR